MIIDCHAHVIQNWIEPGGHPTRSIHARYMQRMLAHTVASAFRARDGAPADTKALLRADDPSWEGLNEVSFRIGRYGQMEFTVDGEDYYVQYMPVGMQNIESPPEHMLAQMTYVGVDHAVLQAGGAYGAMTEYNLFAQSQYPQKFTGLIHLDEAMAGTPEALTLLDSAADRGLKGIYFNYEGFARHGFPWTLDAPQLDPLWERLQERNLVLCAEISGAPNYDKATYVANMLRLASVLDRFPRLVTHLAMGVPVHFFGAGDRWDLPPELEAVYKRDNFYTELMFPITWGGRWDYPYKEAQPLIRDLRDRLGADKLLWGSDMPNVERYCTYRQSLDYIRRYADFLPPAEQDLIFGANTASIYNIKAGS
ncbi:amidohydrolase family protein [Devosia sp.]|uniref:amidohydrolase family protein n=1 Tax=Devosia sp. TaxID=1871048 RepID=UPI002AFFC298|nr:amidohydrolase family protein [Devosia sp.]